MVLLFILLSNYNFLISLSVFDFMQAKVRMCSISFQFYCAVLVVEENDFVLLPLNTFICPPVEELLGGRVVN